MTEHLLTVADVAEHLRLSECTVRRIIRRGDLPASRIAGRLRVTPSDLAAYTDAGRLTTPAEPPPGVRVPAHTLAPRATPANVRDLIARQRKDQAA